MTTTQTQRPARQPRITDAPIPSNYAAPLDWFKTGFKRQEAAIIGALIAAWTGLPFALYLAAAGFLAGAILGFVGAGVSATHLGIFGTVVGSPGGGLFGALVGAVLGTVGGFLLIYYYLYTHPLQLLGALVAGAIVSLAVFVMMETAEPHLMRLRGYRQPSRRERMKINPLLLEAASFMGIDTAPDFWIHDANNKPGAWMHLRAVVLSRGLLGDYDASEDPPKPDLDDAALTAILAHELNHWQSGDVIGLTMISACFFPFVCIVNAIKWIRLRAEWGGVILWCVFWPIWISSRFVVVPLMAYYSRLYELQADHRAASLGPQYRLGLRRALTELQSWEAPRTGWEEILAATHPPTELRLEQLEEAGVKTTTITSVAVPAARPTRPRKPPSQRGVSTKPSSRTKPTATRRATPSVPAPVPPTVRTTRDGGSSAGADDNGDLDARWSVTGGDTPGRQPRKRNT